MKKSVLMLVCILWCAGCAYESPQEGLSQLGETDDLTDYSPENVEKIFIAGWHAALWLLQERGEIFHEPSDVRDRGRNDTVGDSEWNGIRHRDIYGRRKNENIWTYLGSVSLQVRHRALLKSIEQIREDLIKKFNDNIDRPINLNDRSEENVQRVFLGGFLTAKLYAQIKKYRLTHQPSKVLEKDWNADEVTLDWWNPLRPREISYASIVFGVPTNTNITHPLCSVSVQGGIHLLGPLKSPKNIFEEIKAAVDKLPQ